MFCFYDIADSILEGMSQIHTVVYKAEKKQKVDLIL